MAAAALLEDAEWHSSLLKNLYYALGWFAFAVWSISFYPQVLLNYRRKSVVGLNFDFLFLNFTKHTSYLVYNVLLYYNPVVQSQYREKFGESELIPVAPSDVAFSVHAVLLTSITIAQIYIYERGAQKISLPGIAITVAAWGAALILVIVSWAKGQWLWIALGFNIIQVTMTAIKYIPQAWYNYVRKSTVGWSIGNILLDISGGLASLVQMSVQSIDQKSWVNFTGNVGKLGLSLETVVFDILFIIQHYVLYRQRAGDDSYHAIGDPESEVGKPQGHEHHENPFVSQDGHPAPGQNP